MSKQEVEDLLVILNQNQKDTRDFFKDPKSPNIYISYDTFLKNFHLSEANFLEENQNIIDVHLRYRWWVREKMSVYKWVPIVFMTPILFRSFIAMVLVPYATVKLFDHYFESFFLWRYRKQRIINVRNEFVTKLSKDKNKIRRVALFEAIKKDLMLGEQEKLLPIKYIKFGQFTEYVFHAFNEGKEQSSILQTTLFERYIGFKNLPWKLTAPGDLWRSMLEFKKDFVQFRTDPERATYKINMQALLDRPGIKESQIFSLEDNIDNNIRRCTQLFRFIFKGQLEPSQFKLWQHTNFSKYYDIFQPLRFNARDNRADLAIYYAAISLPKLLNVFFKRR